MTHQIEDLVAELRQLEWNATNPYHGKRAFDAEPFLTVIRKIPLRERTGLLLLDLNFFDDGVTTFSEADAYFSEIRVAAIDQIFALYYQEVETAMRLAGRSQADREAYVAATRRFWSQDAYFSRLSRKSSPARIASELTPA